MRIGWYRSVINIPHAFAIGSFLDELAHAAHKDTKDFIVELLGPDHIVDMAHVGLTGKVPGNYGSTSSTTRSTPAATAPFWNW